jgi:hypothetical protein
MAVGAGLIAGLGPNAVLASSHREAPLVAADPQVDGTDLYAFRSPDKPDTVTLISNWIPFETPAGGPNFFAWANGVRYDINIDNNGDAKPDVIYRWVFHSHYRTPGNFLYNTGVVTHLTDATLNFYQTYTLTEIDNGKAHTLLKNAISAPSDVGDASMPDYAALRSQATKKIEGGKGQTLAGQSDDPFFLDLRVFDLLYGGDLSEVGDDTLSGFNVNTLVLQVPNTDVEEGGDGSHIIGVWTTAERKSIRTEDSKGHVKSKGKFVQVSRLGNPLVNEVVVPVSLKDYFNGSKPKNDAQFLGAVQDPLLAHIVNAVYGIPVPDSDPNTAGIQRSDLIGVFLTGLQGLNMPSHVTPSEMLRLNLSTPLCGTGGAPACSTLGAVGGDPQGFPNGRRLSDDIIDEALQVVEGILLPNPPSIVGQLGDGVNANDKPFGNSFPYVALPFSGSDANSPG